MPRFAVCSIGICALVLLTSCLFAPRSFDEQDWLDTVESTKVEDLYGENYADGRFFNPWLPQENRSFSSFLRWRFSRKADYSEEAENNKPQVLDGLMERIGQLNPDRDFLVWIGHATFLARLAGEYWLTDPILTERALLPKRITPPAMSLAELAGLQGKVNVIISHNHYDHLDEETLKNLPKNAFLYVPKGLGKYVSSLVRGEVTEMNWWDSLGTGQGFQLTCLPAQHWSRRLFQGYNTTLWASYLIQAPSATIYFGGDSGYFKGYREIGRKFGHIDYALLPVTAYEPRWFMHHPHMNTAEAIRAFRDLGADYFLPTQWGTFHLGDNPPGLPPLDLKRDINNLKLDSKRFLLVDIGEIILL